MSPRSEQLRARLREAVVALCQEESFYHKELRIEGTLCIVSDQASVLITQISEQIGEVIIKQEDHDLPQLDPEQRQALVYNSVSQPHYLIPGTKRVLQVAGNQDDATIKRQFIEQANKNLNELSQAKLSLRAKACMDYKHLEDGATAVTTSYPTDVNSQKTAMLEQASLTYQTFEAATDQDSSLSQLDESSMQDLPEIVKINKKFQCPLCDKSYAFKHSAKAHLSTHDKNLRHACKLCNAKFAYASSLSSHTKKHHPETMSKEYQCELCQQICVNLSSLKQHYTWRHKDVKFPATYEVVLEQEAGGGGIVGGAGRNQHHQVMTGAGGGGTTVVVAPDAAAAANEHGGGGVMQVQGLRSVFQVQPEISHDGLTVQHSTAHVHPHHHPQHLQTVVASSSPATAATSSSHHPSIITTAHSGGSIIPASSAAVAPISVSAATTTGAGSGGSAITAAGVAVATVVAATGVNAAPGGGNTAAGGGGGGGGGDDALDILQQVIQRYSDDSGTHVHQQFHHTLTSGATLHHPHTVIPMLPGGQQTTIQPSQLLAPLQTTHTQQHQHQQIHLTTTTPTTLQHHHTQQQHHHQQQHQQQQQQQIQLHQGHNSSTTSITATPSVKEKPVIADYFDEVNIQTQHGTYKYQCKTCRNMFKSRHALYEHINTHLGRKPYSCDICGQTFAHHSTLYNHKRNKHTYSSKEEKEAGFKFKCPTCEKRFEFPSALDRHFAKFPEHSVTHENAEAVSNLQRQQHKQQQHHHHPQQHLVTASHEQDDSHQDSNIEEDEEEENME